MPQEVIITNGIATLRTYNDDRIVPIEEYMKSIETRIPLLLPVLPRSAVAVYWDETNQREKKIHVLCELAPGIRNITKMPYGVFHGTTMGKRYRIAVPWTYFWFTAATSSENHDNTNQWSITRTRVFFAKEKYSGIDHQMIKAMLPNLRTDGAVCWGSTGIDTAQPFADQLDQRVNEWYISNFNADYDGYNNLPYRQSYSAAGMKSWVDASTVNAACWRDWPDWEGNNPAKFTVRGLLGEGAIPVEETSFQAVFGIIEPIEIPATFGAWEEWWRKIPQEQRLRARTAFDNFLADNPDGAPDVPAANPAAGDDGGVEVLVAVG